MNIQEFTKQLLRSPEWTRGKLAQAIGVHPTNLSKYLHGHLVRQTTGEKLVSFFLANGMLAYTEQQKQPPHDKP